MTRRLFELVPRFQCKTLCVTRQETAPFLSVLWECLVHLLAQIAKVGRSINRQSSAALTVRQFCCLVGDLRGSRRETRILDGCQTSLVVPKITACV